MMVALDKYGQWLPLDHVYWQHEAMAFRLQCQLAELGWIFWS